MSTCARRPLEEVMRRWKCVGFVVCALVCGECGPVEETAVWHADVPVSRTKPLNSNPLGLDSGITADNV